jgi:acetylornithine deacetylase/succinyl-diaminopimelate desuccinylase-like protein
MGTVLALLVPWVAPASAQTPSGLRHRVDAYRAAHEPEILREFAALLSIPNNAGDTAHIHKNAEYISAMLRKRGLETRLLEVAGAPPIVYAERAVPGAKHTLIFYAHYDGQLVDAAHWATPPWQPVLRDGPLEQGGKPVSLESLPAPVPGEWRIYARSAGDDKAPIQAFVTALDALQDAGIKPSINLKFFFEGEEEAGSPHLPQAIQEYAGLLRSDGWMICDGPVHQTRRMLVSFGARGVQDLEMTVYGPARPLHSGHYGNWAPNPALLLAQLLSSLRDDNAHIKIKGYYDDVRPVSAAERQAIREMPDDDAALRAELGLAWTEGQPDPLPLRIMQPALNVRGIQAGHVGTETQNAIPTQAVASLDFRLVPDQRPERVRTLVEDHIRGQGFYVVHSAPSLEERRAHAKIIYLDWGAGYPAARTPIDSPIARAVVSTIEDTLGAPVVKLPTSGGSVPMYLFTEVLHTPAIGVPIANHDDNQHAANENLRIQNLWDGIDVFAGLLADVEQNWK